MRARRLSKDKGDMPRQAVKPVIREIVVMGDSLSDRGTLRKRWLFGLIPMSLILFFSAKQKRGRFTTGMTWDDDLGAMLAAKFMAEKIDKESFPHVQPDPDSPASHIDEAQDAADEADLLLAHDHNSEHKLQHAFNLNNDAMIPFQGAPYVRTFAEGGLTAHNWKGERAKSFSIGASRKILSTLEMKRNLLIQEDMKNDLKMKPSEALKKKAETLIIEWSGGNDLITVNERPTVEEAAKAVAARIQNVELLIQQGYRNFALFELPDLSLTPRFKDKTPQERDAAQGVCRYFNELLREQVAELKANYPLLNLNVDVFGLNHIFNDVHENPKKYGFTNNGKEPGGPFCSDGLHPTGHMHALLVEEFRDQYDKKYNFQAPVRAERGASHYYHQFMELYRHQFSAEKKGLFGCMRRAGLLEELHRKKYSFHGEGIAEKQYEEALAIILKHALYHKGHRSMRLLKELNWIDKSGTVNIAIPELRRAVEGDEVLMHPEQRGVKKRRSK